MVQAAGGVASLVLSKGIMLQSCAYPWIEGGAHVHEYGEVG